MMGEESVSQVVGKMSQEMARAGMIEETMAEIMEDSDEDEEEVDEEIQKVMDEILPDNILDGVEKIDENKLSDLEKRYEALQKNKQAV
eukprot:CAMPEP_0117426160 /NCGR_PEP_ID=MMETSP0758-20121206/6319_1 /TAXON_ID=63605 /ORGANISM="Percolomonas cosmopolitus, Strain AE-1 (ATCC 50343)" /LENGTH=87 /DNA_ID=CAMNT_0005211141 /DNA_START=485 /DNA_END=748 /DNA_ORIENTATION=-